jgi:hypothetical protein
MLNEPLSNDNLISSMAINPKHPPGPPMTLGNMREQGVRGLAVYCLNHACRHHTVMSARVPRRYRGAVVFCAADEVQQVRRQACGRATELVDGSRQDFGLRALGNAPLARRLHRQGAANSGHGGGARRQKMTARANFCAGGWSGVDRVINGNLALLTVL